MTYQHDRFPELQPQHIAGARLFANRRDMITGLDLPQHGIIAEVGVAHGEFSRFLLDALQPATFYAIDLFEMHKQPIIWGIPQEVLFEGKQHDQFYRDKFASDQDRVVILQGLSSERLADIPSASCDMIYIDAAHDYDNVKRDAQMAQRALKPGGTLIFNDYVMYDPFAHEAYGVIQTVNELVCTENWRVTGFALQHHMFCDIAIRRA